MKVCTLLFLLLVCVASDLPAQLAKKTQSARKEVWTPVEEQAGFELADGFVIELVVSEADGIVNPIDLTFDDAGWLWTQTAAMYPLDPMPDLKWNELQKLVNDPEAEHKYSEFKRIRDLYEGKKAGEDKILIIADPESKKPSRPIVWAEGLTIPQSILPYKNGAFVAQGPELFFLSDSDDDGKADERTAFLAGFGFTDTHTMVHTLVRAPGDWIHFSQGALNKGEVTAMKSGAKIRVDYSKIVRMSLDGGEIGIVSSGLNNIWGFQLRGNGQWFGTEANDLSWSIVPMEAGTGFRGIGGQRIRPYQPWFPPLHEFRVGGTGISGLAFADDASGSFPAEWKDVALLANPITSTINAVRIVRNPDGTVTAEHLPDLLTSKDDWFRPVNIEFGPDGCLYIADWYNKIVSHNEVSRSHPDRDKSHGRIWRIRHVSQKPRKIPNFYEMKNADLIEHLKSPSLWQKRAAWHQISDRDAMELAPGLVSLSADTSLDIITRILALWSLEGIKHFDAELMESLLQSTNDELRREAVRSLASFAISPAQASAYLKGFVDDENVMVRSQVLRTLTDLGKANSDTIDILLNFCRPALLGETMGGPYERNFERYLARKALEQYASELDLYLASPMSEKQPANHLFWAIQALPEEARKTKFPELWKKLKDQELDRGTFINVSQLLGDADIDKVVKSVFDDPDNANHLAALAIQDQALVQSPGLAAMLETSARFLIRSKDKASIHRGLDLLAKLKVPYLREDVIKLMDTSERGADTAKRILSVLELEPNENRAVFNKILADNKSPFGLKQLALRAFCKADVPKAQARLKTMLESMSAVQKTDTIASLSASPQGALVLLGLFGENVLTAKDFDFTTAERMLSILKKNKHAKKLFSILKKLEDKKKEAFQHRLEKYMAIAEKRGGDPELGKGLFTGLCLSCHIAGSEGAGIAPALDGSANRTNEALLTAILDPDAAVEGGYVLYRISKKDGSIVEGFMQNKDDRGTTLRFMGGGQLFVDAADIQSGRYVGGRSVMPKNLVDGLPDDQFANLLAYIRTLK